MEDPLLDNKGVRVLEWEWRAKKEPDIRLKQFTVMVQIFQNLNPATLKGMEL